MQAVINVFYSNSEFAVNDFENAVWQNSEVAPLVKLWSGADAPEKRSAEARIIWTRQSLSVRFDCAQYEPLVVAAHPNLEQKTIGLWERDVCEIFIAPAAGEPERYFEFEAAPTGEWLDLAIRQVSGKRETDWNYNSGIKTAARVNAEKNLITIIMQIGWQAFGKKPQAGDIWRANLFRCVGTHEKTRYLAWQPTRTENPNFHVPAAFGRLKFVKVES